MIAKARIGELGLEESLYMWYFILEPDFISSKPVCHPALRPTPPRSRRSKEDIVNPPPK